MIPEDILKQYGAKERKLDKHEELIRFGTKARYYFQVKSGQIKMNNFNDEGREFIQGIFSAGESFGEPPLFGEFKYPAGAVAIESSTVLALDKESFFRLLSEHAEIALGFTKTLARRLHYKAIIAAEISTQDAGHRILALLDYFKSHVYHLSQDEVYDVKLTRQQIADLTGLRVETVIRSIKNLAGSGEIEIINHKVRR